MIIITYYQIIYCISDPLQNLYNPLPQTIYNNITPSTHSTNSSPLYNKTNRYNSVASDRDSSYSSTQLHNNQSSSYGYSSVAGSICGGVSGTQYSEVAGDVLYHEIPKNVYSDVTNDDILKPHRPAPTKPGLMQPLSMQQIQRKIQQGTVRYF